MKQKLVDYIQYALQNKPLAYQLGFLQAFVAQLMYNDTKVLAKFKQQIEQANKTHK